MPSMYEIEMHHSFLRLPLFITASGFGYPAVVPSHCQLPRKSKENFGVPHSALAFGW